MSMRMVLLAVFLALGIAAVEGVSAARQFIIFFHEGERDRLDPKQWLVTDAGVDVAKDVAATHKGSGGAILLIGNDQNVGSAAEAVVRSRRRAEAVQDLIVQFGVPRAAIRTKACGFSNPLLESPKGVSAPQNRYVVIELLASQSEAAAAANAVCPAAAREAGE